MKKRALLKKLRRIFLLTIVSFLALIYIPLIKETYLMGNVGTRNSENVKNDTVVEQTEVSIMIGLPTEEIMKQYGMPTRRYPSLYGYEWWVYYDEEHPSTYFQIGVMNNIIVTSYIIGTDVTISPFQIGDSYSDIMKNHQLNSEISFFYDGNEYIFTLSEREMMEQPLLQLDDDVWAQLYFDTFQHTLSSVRLMNTKVLLLLRPYELSYTGQLPELPILTDEERREVEIGEEQSIFELTNVMRTRFQLPPLSWNEVAAEVALLHSKDMERNQYFSHESPTEGSLGDRLQRKDVLYEMSGENIAANQIDAIAAVEAWMNSEGHRKNMLYQEFTSLGVGVYRKYYTQNFIK